MFDRRIIQNIYIYIPPIERVRLVLSLPFHRWKWKKPDSNILRNCFRERNIRLSIFTLFCRHFQYLVSIRFFPSSTKEENNLFPIICLRPKPKQTIMTSFHFVQGNKSCNKPCLSVWKRESNLYVCFCCVKFEFRLD